MGLYDRDYSRRTESGYHVAAPQSATMQLLVVTVGVYIAQLLFAPLTDLVQLPADWYRRPWEAYRLLTYGFAHAPDRVEHIILNMLVLGMFGKQIEYRYGRAQFLVFYLGAIVFAGIAWSLSTSLSGGSGVMYGASGGTTAIFLLFALNYPRQEVQLMFVLPVPAWVAALLLVGSDLFGVVRRADAGIAFTAHLAGALLALYFFYGRGSSHAGWLTGKFSGVSLKPRPKLRVHQPDGDEDDLSKQVDAILAKIQEQGQDSLTRGERKILEQASRRYQEKRK